MRIVITNLPRIGMHLVLAVMVLFTLFVGFALVGPESARGSHCVSDQKLQPLVVRNGQGDAFWNYDFESENVNRARWTLARPGFGDLDLTLDGGRTKFTVPYRLPRGAQQGPDEWYPLRLHFAITFGRGDGRGKVWVSGVTNDYAGVLLEFTRSVRGGPIDWNSVDLLKGWVERRTAVHKVTLAARNYLPYRGVRPGRNTFTVTLRRSGDLRVDRLEVFADSGIEVTPRSPARLVLEPVLPRDSVQPGEEFDVGYRLRNRGDRPAHDVVVGVLPRQRGAPRVIGSGRRRLGRIDDGARGRFRLTARESGNYRLLLAVDSHAGHASKMIEVSVASAVPQSSGGAPWARLVTAGVLVLTGMLLLLRGRLRRSTPQRAPGR